MKNYAMVICILELGLRSYEVAHLKLDDINWHTQTVHLSPGKTRQTYVLPMTQPMINSLIEYLRYGRPKTTSRQVFVQHRALVGKSIVPRVISDVVRRALKQANVTHTSLGSNLLRRTFATKLLQKGATIKQIADLLRHRSIDTTVIYTKVDFSKLAEVALPWPEELS